MKTKQILIFGAGRSAYSLIEYLAEHSEVNNTELVIVDRSAGDVIKRIKAPNVIALDRDLTDRDERQRLIKKSDLVVSMLPARFHIMVAEDCITFGKNMVTASYANEDMEYLHNRAVKANIILLNEVGLDPGIDHMSAMKVIHEIQESGGTLKGFESFTGGLLSPESEEGNPWKYKFTWNPRNVVIASSSGAVKFLDHDNFKFIPYHRVFRRTELINLEKYGRFEGYANRDSLKYRELYGLQNIETMYRGTLRRPGFCKAWDLFVQLGATDDSYAMEDSENLTYRSFINAFLKYHPTDSVELKLMQYLKLDQDDVDIIEKLEWLDLFKDIKVGLKNATPAEILQHILEKKWTLSEHERDMIVMWHKFTYELNGAEKELQSSMVYEGHDQFNTAMSKTVGLPLAICVEMILSGELDQKGVVRPLTKELYLPVLRKLKRHGIIFNERQIK